MNAFQKNKSTSLAGVGFLYVISIASLGFIFIYPGTATWLGFEDGLIENITALLLLASSVVMARHGVRSMYREQRNSLLPVLLVTVSVFFFVFAGEEISWGQRIFGIAPNDFLIQRNWQDEVNFHNLHTDLFNIAFHYGAFLFLIFLPLFRSVVLPLFKKIRLNFLQYLIAPRWIAAPSFIFLGMLDPRFLFVIEKPWVAFLYLTVLFVGFGILLYEFTSAISTKNKFLEWQLVLSFAVLCFGLYVSYLQSIDTTPNTISEYKELVVASGLLVFSLTWKSPY